MAKREEVDASAAPSGSTVFVVVQEMDCDRSGGADVVAVYDTEAKANARIQTLETERDENERRYKYPVSWFAVELEINKDDRWS